jgi:hypothetical protein
VSIPFQDKLLLKASTTAQRERAADLLQMRQRAIMQTTGSCSSSRLNYVIGAAVMLIVAVALVNRLGAYAYPVRRDLVPNLAAEPAV